MSARWNGARVPHHEHVASTCLTHAGALFPAGWINAESVLSRRVVVGEPAPRPDLGGTGAPGARGRLCLCVLRVRVCVCVGRFSRIRCRGCARVRVRPTLRRAAAAAAAAAAGGGGGKKAKGARSDGGLAIAIGYETLFWDAATAEPQKVRTARAAAARAAPPLLRRTGGHAYRVKSVSCVA
jgi:hypothetical protein